MKRSILVLSILAMAAAALAEPNEIGIYTTEDGDHANTSYNGVPGTFTAYVVCTDPVNFDYGWPGSGVQQAVTTIGGFEFKIVLPAGVVLLGYEMPPESLNVATPPEWFAGTNAPVVDGHCTLLTLSLGAFVQEPSQIYLSPVTSYPPSVPGLMALTDYNDDFRLIAAYPVSGGFAMPVFGLWSSVVPTEDASWGDLKSLYR